MNYLRHTALTMSLSLIGAIAAPSVQAAPEFVNGLALDGALLDKSGGIVTKSDRSVTIDGFSSESYRISGRMRTLDAADSPKVRVRAQFIHDKK